MRTTEPPVPEFDQIVKGNVSIKKLSKHKYTITYQLTCIDDDDVCITTLDTLLEDHTYTSFDSDTFREYLVRFDLILYDENNEELYKYLLNPKT